MPNFKVPKTFANDSVSYPDMQQKFLSNASAPKPSILSMPLQSAEDGSGAKGRGLTPPLANGQGLASLIKGTPQQGQMSPQILALMQMLQQWMGRK